MLKNMNPYAYAPGMKTAAARSQVKIPTPSMLGKARSLLSIIMETPLNSATALAMILFLAGVVGSMTLVAYSEMASGSYEPMVSANKAQPTARVLGMASYGYNQPVCGYNTANCLNYQLLDYSSSQDGWRVKIDYQLQGNIVGAIKVNGWRFMDNISGSGSGYTGYDLEPGETYNFVLYKKVGGRLYRLTKISLTMPEATAPTPTPTPQPITCAQDAYQCPNGSWVGRTWPNCQFVCPSYGYQAVNVGPVNQGSWREGWIERFSSNNYSVAPSTVTVSGWAFDEGKDLTVTMKLRNVNTGALYSPDNIQYLGLRQDVGDYLTAKRGAALIH